MDIDTIQELVEGVRNSKTGGYEVDFNVLPNQERARAGDGFFLIIQVQDTEPGSALNGEWWFWADGTVMQVL
jgi:hypothetical protein